MAKRNMKEWKESVIANPRKQGAPVLTFPSVQLTGATVKQLVTDAQIQADGMKFLTERTPSLVATSMMDLTVEAEACGAEVRVPENDVPATLGELIKTKADAENMKVPEIGAGRTQLFIDATKKAAEMITDRPVLAGIAGPYTMAGRLIGMTEMMMACMKEPEMVTIVMEKCTEFITKYALAYKEQTNAGGFVMAEPMMGLLSPKLSKKFVAPYCKQIVEAVQDEEFVVIFHNCGGNVTKIADQLIDINAEGYHFGNVINMADICPLLPADKLVMGNIDPANQFCFGTAESMKENTKAVMESCHKYPNFVISSGCDIGPNASWECIDAFYEAIDEFYMEKGL